MNKSFTLLELLIVMSVISILATILLIVIKPQEILSKARDTERISALKNYEKNIKLALLEPEISSQGIGTANIIYVSLKDSSIECSSHLSTLPSLPTGWSYKCSENPSKADGTGWIPINFASSSILNINQLNLDPKNETLFYYSYAVSESNNFELTAYLEYEGNSATTSSPSADDGGTTLELYEAGDDKTITPISFEEGRVSDAITKGVWTVRDFMYIITPADPSVVYDNNMATYIELNPDISTYFYIEQDFQEEKLIQKFRVNTSMLNSAVNVDYYDSGTGWNNIFIIQTNDWIEIPIDITITKWRIGFGVKTGSPSFTKINEMRAYGF